MADADEIQRELAEYGTKLGRVSTRLSESNSGLDVQVEAAFFLQYEGFDLPFIAKILATTQEDVTKILASEFGSSTA